MAPTLETTVRDKRVILGLSGGVDSAVAAILLQRAGADVHALHMTNWEDDDGYCTAASDLQDARDVCEHLGVTLHHVNFAKQYRDQVFEYFLDEYRAGRTPNPDILCNREIKFGVFRDYAKRLGGTYSPPGTTHVRLSSTTMAHCSKARTLERIRVTSCTRCRQMRWPSRFFLWANCKRTTCGAWRATAVFEFTAKKTVPESASSANGRFGIPQYLPASQSRPHADAGGDDMGQHQGLMYYTLGQRQGLGIGGRNNRSEAPWYVVGKNLDDNVLIVAQGEHELLYTASLLADKASWIGNAPTDLEKGLSCHAKVRYRQTDQACTVEKRGDGQLSVRFESPQKAVAPGQFVVFTTATGVSEALSLAKLLRQGTRGS